MEIKDIVVHVDSSERTAERVQLATRIAADKDAHVTGVFVIPDPYTPALMAGGYVPTDIFDQFRQEAIADSEKAKELFLKITDAGGVHSEWRTEEGVASTVVARHARYSDLCVVGKGDYDEPVKYPHAELPADLMMTSGRPVLVVPNAGHFEVVGTRILVCWNTSREATRAVNDAMPFLQAAEKVTVLAVNPHKSSGGDHGDTPSADISLHLARHGVNAEAASTVASGIDVADTILARASDLGVDMIVSGAYGHSRTREWVFGGVTESLLRNTTVPTLLSH
jgi:nucleotide-binding universal stress UspA family protein